MAADTHTDTDRHTYSDRYTQTDTHTQIYIHRQTDIHTQIYLRLHPTWTFPNRRYHVYHTSQIDVSQIDANCIWVASLMSLKCLIDGQL